MQTVWQYFRGYSLAVWYFFEGVVLADKFVEPVSCTVSKLLVHASALIFSVVSNPTS